MENNKFQTILNESQQQFDSLFQSKNNIIVKQISSNSKDTDNWNKVLLLNNKYYFAIGFSNNSNFIQYLKTNKYDENNDENKVEYSWLSDLGPFKKLYNTIVESKLKNELNKFYIFLFENFEEYDIYDYDEDEDEDSILNESQQQFDWRYCF